MKNKFEFIKKIIDDSDYYLLIIGNRYGTVSSDGVSYTEKEYEYAIEKKIKVIALIHSDPLMLPVSKSEISRISIKKLEEFRNKVSTGRIVKYWSMADELPGLVALSLINAIKMYPAFGWERGSSYENSELLMQINKLRIENDDLKQCLATKTNEVKFFLNDLPSAFTDIFKLKHIKKLRIFAHSTATIQPKFADASELIIDECIIMLKRLPANDQLFEESYENSKFAAIQKWKLMVCAKTIKKLSIIEYDRDSDIWYVICDNDVILTDLFIMNSNRIPYAIQKDKASIIVTSSTDAGKKYISRYINQFDNYVNYYREKYGTICEEENDFSH